MALPRLRPLVSELVFHLYDQPLHPELFETRLCRRVRCGEFSLTVRITRTGHALSWDSAGRHLTEVATTGDAQLPTRRCLIQKRIRGENSTSHAWAPGLSYQSSFQVETMPGEVFVHLHDEILRDGLKRGLLHNFRPNNRLALSPLSYVTMEAWAGSLVVSTFHTFPDEFTVVKTQSLIEPRR